MSSVRSPARYLPRALPWGKRCHAAAPRQLPLVQMGTDRTTQKQKQNANSHLSTRTACLISLHLLLSVQGRHVLAQHSISRPYLRRHPRRFLGFQLPSCFPFDCTHLCHGQERKLLSQLRSLGGRGGGSFKPEAGEGSGQARSMHVEVFVSTLPHFRVLPPSPKSR